MKRNMKPLLMSAQGVAIALFLVLPPIRSQDSVFAGSVEADPAITIVFKGLMVFDIPSTGSQVQVVRLHSGADGHRVHIRIAGPGYDHPYEWHNTYPRGAALSFRVVKKGPLPTDSANFPTDQRPKNIRELHPHSDTLGDLFIKEDAFGPTLTLH